MSDKEKLSSAKRNFRITFILLVLSSVIILPCIFLCAKFASGLPIVIYVVYVGFMIFLHSQNSKKLLKTENLIMKQIWNEIENSEEAKNKIRSSGVRPNFANRFINTYPTSMEYLMSRTNGLRTIHAEKHIDLELTEKILTAISNREKTELDSDCDELRKVHIAYNQLLDSEVIGYPDKLFATNADELEASIAHAKGVCAKLSPIVMKYYDKNRIAFSFHIYPHRVLVYLENSFASTFVAAYYNDILKLRCTEYLFNAEPVVVNEKSKEPMEYYNKFCPVSNTEIVGSHWKVTNKDGSRSFRGGLSPENNPLYFTLRFGTLAIDVGSFHGKTTFSRYRSVVEFVTLINNMMEQYKVN